MSYDDWKTETPEEERDRLRRLQQRALVRRYRDPDDELNERLERERERWIDE